jgi:uncharacterized YccA/Bax inhibitor family protein
VRIGASLLLIAIGAILKFAVTDHVSNVNLATVGVILMVIGAIGLVLSLAFMAIRRRTDVVQESRPMYVDGPGQPAPRARTRTTYYEPNDYDY